MFFVFMTLNSLLERERFNQFSVYFSVPKTCPLWQKPTRIDLQQNEARSLSFFFFIIVLGCGAAHLETRVKYEFTHLKMFSASVAREFYLKHRIWG